LATDFEASFEAGFETNVETNSEAKFICKLLAIKSSSIVSSIVTSSKCKVNPKRDASIPDYAPEAARRESLQFHKPDAETGRPRSI
jgi:hypothetical protein